jgi:DNA-binding response OmpR family regulator
MALIMFVDDDVDTLNMLKKCVELFGHQAILAHNRDEALDLVNEYNLDMVFTDLYLCDASGLDIVSALRKNEKTSHIPVYVLSAAAEYELAGRVRMAGANAYMQKPIRIQSLLNAISLTSASPNSGLALGGVL